MLDSYKDGVFENDSLRAYFNNSRKNTFDTIKSADEAMYFARSKGVKVELRGMSFCPPRDLETEIEVACAAGRLVGMWEYLTHLSNPEAKFVLGQTALYEALLGSALVSTDEAMHEIGSLPRDLRIQYYLNGLPLWRELETLHAQLDQNDHSVEVLETAKAIADSTPWKEITKAEAGFAARISNAQTWWREQHKPAPTSDEAAKEVTARPLPPAPPGIGHYRLLRDIAADVTVQTLEHMKFADLPHAVAAVEVSSFIDDDGHFSLGKVAECAGNLSGLWAFHDAHTSDEVGQAIIPEMLTKTTHAFDAILSGTLGKRPALLFGELTSHLHNRLARIAGRTIEMAAEPAKRAQSGKISFLVERRAATASLQ